MANPRKVQQEIDKLMKKVQEGMDVYEATFDKVQSAGDRVQKEKFEAELKKEIKKLQRLREQIKGLHASPEVKDKRQLEQTRRAIEVKMEGFKVCERETKTKAFSKEGLATTKNDPAARAKAKTVGWIRSAIQELQDQIEQLEFDIENDGFDSGKRRGKQQSKTDEREERMKRNKYHIVKLESILRVLEMGELEPEDVDEIEPDVQGFIDGYQDPTFEEDEMDIYEMFDIPDMVQDIAAGHGRDDESDSDDDSAPAAKAPPKKETPAAKAKETPPEKVAPKPAAKKAPAEVAPKKQPTPAAPAKVTPIPVVNTAPKTPITPLTAKGPASPGAPKSMADMLAGNRKRDEPAAAPAASQPSPAAAASAAASAAAPAAPAAPKVQPKAEPAAPAASSMPADEAGLLDDDDDMNDDTFGDEAMEGVSVGGGNLADLAGMTSAKLGGDWAKPLPPTVGGVAALSPLSNAPSLPPAGPPAGKATLDAPAPRATEPMLPTAAPPSQGTSNVPTDVSAVAAAAAAATSQSAAEGVSSAARSGSGAVPGTDLIQRMLNVSLQNLPTTSDCERPKPYSPPNPYQTPDYYPQTVHPAFSAPETFARFEADTLFFIFYYQQACYQQYLAAKELKRQSWRFHKKYQTWFQRHDRPKVTTDEHEQGTYIYFDFEGGWCQRIKADFVFKYAQLEDSLQ